MRELKSPTTEFAADTFTPLINSESSPQLKDAFLLRTAARGLAFGSGRAFFHSLMLNGQQSVCGSKEQLSAERHGRKKKKERGQGQGFQAAMPVLPGRVPEGGRARGSKEQPEVKGEGATLVFEK